MIKIVIIFCWWDGVEEVKRGKKDKKQSDVLTMGYSKAEQFYEWTPEEFENQTLTLFVSIILFEIFWAVLGTCKLVQQSQIPVTTYWLLFCIYELFCFTLSTLAWNCEKEVSAAWTSLSWMTGASSIVCQMQRAQVYFFWVYCMLLWAIIQV